MKDFLQNEIETGDTVIVAVSEGKYPKLSRAYVRDTAMRKQFADGVPIPMVYIEYSNIVKFWIPASKVMRVPAEMLPEKRREKLNGAKEDKK